MGVASAGNERKIYDFLGCSSLPSDANHGQRSRPFTIKKDLPGLLGWWTRAAVYLGGDALSRVKWC